MNFNIIESKYIDWEKIHDEFTDDFLFSPLSNADMRMKYGMTYGEFRHYSKIVKAENNISRRPFWRYRNNSVKNYYPSGNGFQIRKRINGRDEYIGFVRSEELAVEIVEMCENASWNVDVCRQILKRRCGDVI